jgi:hypothetical protein
VCSLISKDAGVTVAQALSIITSLFLALDFFAGAPLILHRPVTRDRLQNKRKYTGYFGGTWPGLDVDVSARFVQSSRGLCDAPTTRSGVGKPLGRATPWASLCPGSFEVHDQAGTPCSRLSTISPVHLNDAGALADTLNQRADNFPHQGMFIDYKIPMSVLDLFNSRSDLASTNSIQTLSTKSQNC